MRRSFLIAALLLAGCGHSSETRFWTLDAVAPPLVAALPNMAPVRVDAVHVPIALDRLELTSRSTANRIVVRDFDRWTAPLGDLIRRTLTQDLLARLPGEMVIFPDAPKPPGCRSIIVDVLDIQPSTVGWTMDVTWSIRGAAARRGQRRLQARAAPDGARGQAIAISDLVAQLSDELAAAATR